MNWVSAHRLSMLAAAKAHRRYAVDVSKRVDVFSIIEAQGIILAFQPMPKLSGALVLEPAASPGIIVNANHPLSRQRFTAAHELGHYFMGHGPSVDPERLERGGDSRWPDEEKLAEAFAEWFLMPAMLVGQSLAELEIPQPKSASDAYQLSLRMGTSYDATVRHLESLRHISRPTANVWVRTPPAKVKREIGGEFVPENASNDVWVVRSRASQEELMVRPGDRVIVRVDEIPTSGYMWRAGDKGSPAAMLADEYVPTDQPLSELMVVGDRAEHVFVFGIHESDAKTRTAISLVRGPAWEPNVVDAAFDIVVDVQAPRLGISESHFVTA